MLRICLFVFFRFCILILILKLVRGRQTRGHRETLYIASYVICLSSLHGLRSLYCYAVELVALLLLVIVDCV